MQWSSLSGVGLLACAVLGSAQAAEPAVPITCASPVGATDTAKTIKARLGKDAVIKTVPGAEGQDTKALVLYPKDKKRELVVTFFDDGMTKLAGVALGENATGWTIAGISMGSGLDVVQKANGKSFGIAGFNWDYGGYVTGWRGGTLDKPLEGGCSVSVRFGTKDPNLPANMSGDGVTIASSNPRLIKAKPVVQELSMGFAEKN